MASGFRAGLNAVQDRAKILVTVFASGPVAVANDMVYESRRHSGSVSARTRIDGSTHGQKLTLRSEFVQRSRKRRWRRPRLAAAWHSTLRLSALSEMPAALKAGRRDGALALLRQGFGITHPRSPAS